MADPVDLSPLRASPGDASLAPAQRTRIDGPHGPQIPPTPAAVAGESRPDVIVPFPEDSLPQFRLQARQLAALLRNGQEQLELRSEQVHAQRADLDQDLRESRQWLDERRLEMSIRETQAASLETEQAEQFARLQGAKGDLAQAHDRLDNQRRRLEDRQRELEERWRSTAREDRQAAAEQSTDLTRRQQALDQRQAQLDRRQADLAEARRETLLWRLALEERWRELFCANGEGELPAVADQRQRLAAELTEQSESHRRQRAEMFALGRELAARQESLAARRAAVERWAAQRQEDLARQAAELTAQRMELAEREQGLVQNLEGRATRFLEAARRRDHH